MILINSNNLGKFYKHVNQCSVHHTGIGPLNDLSGQMVLDDSEKSNLLNSYFVSVGTIDSGFLPPLPVLVEEADSKLDLITYRTQQIRLILKKLKNKISSGPDGLPPILFHNLANQLAYPLATIFNLFMQAGTVPDIWRQARVTPIFKKGLHPTLKLQTYFAYMCWLQDF